MTKRQSLLGVRTTGCEIRKVTNLMRPAFQTMPLSPTIGVEISGLRIVEKMAEQTIGEIAALLYQHAVVCIRDQELKPSELLAFGARLGEPVVHNEINLRIDGSPAVMSLSNADQRDDRQLNGGAHWHTDLVHTEQPASFTMLNAIAVPSSGGGTLFADQASAYQTLPATTRQRVDAMTVIHCYEGRTDGSMPQVRHPLVRPHPVSGTRALYAAADTGIGIDSMADNDAKDFLRELADHATDQRFVYRHDYQPNDVVIWDNAQLLHCAGRLERAQTPEQQRIMHRVSVRGWPSPAD
jgi:taurine dioxygenase